MVLRLFFSGPLVSDTKVPKIGCHCFWRLLVIHPQLAQTGLSSFPTRGCHSMTGRPRPRPYRPDDCEDALLGGLILGIIFTLSMLLILNPEAFARG